LVVGYPIDRENRGPKDGLARLEGFRTDRGSARTLVWLPSLLGSQAQKDLGQLVRLDHILSQNRFADYVRDLSQVDRESARSILTNQRDALGQRLITYLNVAYGLQNDPGGVLDGMQSIGGEEHFQSLSPGLELNVPGETHLSRALVDLLHQALASQYPGHPEFDKELKITKGAVQKVLEVVTGTLRTKERRLRVEKADRALVRQIANPLKLGEMGEDHFVMGERWKDHFQRAAAKGEGLDRIRVQDLRRWMDESEPMGLPPLLQDLVILSFAQQTNRSFTLHGGPFTPEPGGKWPDECALTQQALPAEPDWERAVEIVHTALGVAGLPSFMSGQNVARFSETVKAEVERLKLQETAPKLKAALEQRAADFGCTGQAFERLVTAQEGVKLALSIRDRSDAALIEAIARLDLQAALAAIGTSLKKAGNVADKVKGADLTAVNSVSRLEGKAGEEGRRLRDDLFEAFRHNEYAVPFGSAFDTINREAIRLLSSLVQKEPKRNEDGPGPGVTEPVPQVTEKRAGLISRWGRSQVEGDDVPGWVPIGVREKLLAVVQVRDVHAGGKLGPVVVTQNLAALLAGAGDAEIDSGTGQFRIPGYGIDCRLSTDPGREN
ncbi:MAG: hypothetical protein JO015_01570, partial [Verrucomicrobia bacterium]|nr:hypothetical protein [Verrucomicrobiota bacterium]